MSVSWVRLGVMVMVWMNVPGIESGPQRDGDPDHPSEAPPSWIPPDFYDWLDDYECQTNECQNGGTCLFQGDDVYICLCPEGYTGWECEIRNRCYGETCQHGGICGFDYFTEEFYCVCQDGWEGEMCQTATDVTSPCTAVDCANGGTCYYDLGSSFCACTPDFYGWHCEHQSTVCNELSPPCANGGACVGGPYGSICVCTSAWSGRDCTQSFLCDGYCENGGTCKIWDSYGPRCNCTPGWRGTRCSQPSISTAAFLCDGYCNNGGSCYIRDNAPTCKCASGWEGTHCAYTLPLADTPGTGGIIGSIIGALVLFLVFAGGVCVMKMVQKRSSRPPRQARATPLENTPRPPAMIYDPSVHNAGFDDSAVLAAPHRKVSHPYSQRNPALGAHRYSQPPQRRQPPEMAMRPNSQPSVARNPMAGAYDYAYAVEPGGVTRPSGMMMAAAPPHRAPMVGPREDQSDHAYAYAAPPRPVDPSRAPAAHSVTGSPPAYSSEPTVAPQSRTPSRVGSRMSEHTYQSISEYEKKPAPSVTSEGSRYSSRK